MPLECIKRHFYSFPTIPSSPIVLWSYSQKRADFSVDDMVESNTRIRYDVRAFRPKATIMSSHETELPSGQLAQLQVRGEGQRHGFDFEEWVRTTFFDEYEGKYTQDWDVPAMHNQRFGHIPVSIKTAKYGSPIGLGDALRQFNIAQPFLLIVGFWRQNKDGLHKNWTNITSATIQPDQWKKLWSPIKLSDLQRLDACIKDRSLHYNEARRQARLLKSAPPFSQAAMVVNPKIDSKIQRRLQCSLPFKALFDELSQDADCNEIERPQLFGTDAPVSLRSEPRKFNRTNTGS